MFSVLSQALFEAGLPVVPLFKTSNLPAVPADKIEVSNTKLHVSNWQSQHEDKGCGVPMGIPLPSDTTHALVALAINVGCGDLKMGAKSVLDEGAWQMTTAKFSYWVFRIPIEHIPETKSIFASGQHEPMACLLGEGATINITNHMQLPQQTTLPEVTVDVLMDVIKDFSNQPELYSEPYQVESDGMVHTITQLNVKMRVYLTHFCYELLLKSDENTQLLPILQEIEALYDNFSRKIDYIPQQNNKSSFFQVFYNMVYQERIKRCLLLPPNWSLGIGSALREKYEIPFKKSDTQFDFKGIQDHIYLLMSDAIGNESKMLNACQQSMDEIARSFTLTKLEVDQLKRYISRQSGIKLNMSKMDSQIRQIRDKYRGVTDLPMIVAQVTGFLNQQTEHRFDTGVNAQQIHRWNGTHWDPVGDHEISNVVNTYFSSPLTERSGRNMTNIVQAVKNSLTLPLRRVSCSGVNFKNGFVDATMSLSSHDPDMGLTYTLPFVFHADQKTPPPKFGGFLSTLWPNNPDAIDALQEAMASTFFQSATLFQRAVLLYGPPESGKSQLLNIIRALVPPNMRVSVSPDKWQDNESLAALSNKMLNLCGELSETQPLNSQRFKDIVDGNEVTLKKTVASHITLYPNAAHWFASNHLPKTKDFSDGFTRRWLILKTDRMVPKDERVIDLGNQIVESEKDRIISWALQGYPRLIDNHEYTLPPEHHQLVSELGHMNNNVRYFFEAAGVVSFKARHEIAVLRSLPQSEMVAELSKRSSISGRDLYTHYCATVQALKNGPVVDESEFYRRSRELSSIHNFLQVVGRDSENRVSIRFYGLDLNTKKALNN